MLGGNAEADFNCLRVVGVKRPTMIDLTNPCAGLSRPYRKNDGIVFIKRQPSNDFGYPRSKKGQRLFAGNRHLLRRSVAPTQQWRAISSSTCCNQAAELASLGMWKLLRGDRQTEPTLGPSGRQERLNCCWKKRR